MRAGVLLSVGTHPTARRARVSHADLAALRLAQGSGLPVVGLHAGEDNDVLHDYGAYGLQDLVILPQGTSGGVDELAHLIASDDIALVVAGNLSEGRDAQGILPYHVAAKLGWRLIPDVVGLEPIDDRFVVISRLDGSTHRRYADAARSVLVAWPGGAELMVHASAQRERLAVRNVGVATEVRRVTSEGEATPTRRMPPPPWTQPDPTAPASARLSMLRGTSGAPRGRVLLDPPPQEAIRQVLDFLCRHGLHVPQRITEGCTP